MRQAVAAAFLAVLFVASVEGKHRLNNANDLLPAGIGYACASWGPSYGFWMFQTDQYAHLLFCRLQEVSLSRVQSTLFNIRVGAAVERVSA